MRLGKRQPQAYNYKQLCHNTDTQKVFCTVGATAIGLMEKYYVQR